GKVKAEEMLAKVQQSASLEAACRALVDLANERGGEDNITVVLARIEGEGVKMPRDQETLTQTFQVLAEYKAAGAALTSDAEDEDEGHADPPAPAAAPEVAARPPAPAPTAAAKPPST